MRLRAIAALCALIAIVSIPLSAFAQTRVGNADELDRALASARGGEIITLQPGDYGELPNGGRTNGRFNFASPVTLISADPTRPARFSRLNLRAAANLVFDGVEMRYRFAAGDPIHLRPFGVRESRAVTFRNCRFIGDNATGTGTPADGYGYAIGLDVVGSQAVLVENCTFSVWHRAGVIARSTDVTLRGNTISGVRSDGFNFAQVNRVTIEGNRFGAFRTNLTTGDHPDMIQFWTNQTTAPSTDIVIRGNILDIGDGPWTQSIFMRNEEVDTGRKGREMFYRNIVITGNFIRNSHVHGITVGETDGLEVSNNTLIQAAESPRVLHVTVPGINIRPASENVRVVRNVTPRLPDRASAGWVVADNLSVQRNFPRMPGFYNQVFVDAMVPGRAPLSSFAFLPGAFPNGPAPGAPAALFGEQSQGPRLVILSSIQTPGRGGEHRLEAALFAPSGRQALTGARARWEFADGSAKEGLVVTHRFPASGMHRPRLTVTLPSGERLEAARSILAE